MNNIRISGISTADYEDEVRYIREQQYYREHYCCMCGDPISSPERVYDAGYLYCSWECWAIDVERQNEPILCDSCGNQVGKEALSNGDGNFCSKSCAEAFIYEMLRDKEDA